MYSTSIIERLSRFCPSPMCLLSFFAARQRKKGGWRWVKKHRYRGFQLLPASSLGWLYPECAMVLEACKTLTPAYACGPDQWPLFSLLHFLFYYSAIDLGMRRHESMSHSRRWRMIEQSKTIHIIRQLQRVRYSANTILIS